VPSQGEIYIESRATAFQHMPFRDKHF